LKMQKNSNSRGTALRKKRDTPTRDPSKAVMTVKRHKGGNSKTADRRAATASEVYITPELQLCFYCAEVGIDEQRGRVDLEEDHLRSIFENTGFTTCALCKMIGDTSRMNSLPQTTESSTLEPYTARTPISLEISQDQIRIKNTDSWRLYGIIVRDVL
jgi:hypothetical protein